ncbi:hypothetical protein TSH58p_25360 (plasmid) [Azospirillum sp. TSH58]|nr:hypothetical protein TSH58p_25360 [Azospirillum sp. TSH58]PWC62893.1 hypothetical protein TSH58_24540 [Azospirillum sp. TSH58]
MPHHHLKRIWRPTRQFPSNRCDLRLRHIAQGIYEAIKCSLIKFFVEIDWKGEHCARLFTGLLQDPQPLIQRFVYGVAQMINCPDVVVGGHMGATDALIDDHRGAANSVELGPLGRCRR